MYIKKKRLIIIILAALITVLVIPTIIGAIPTPVGASTAIAANGYEINWWTVDGGGGTSESAGGQYVLKGTIGQHDASNTTEGRDYSLRGGFWVEGILTIIDYIINLPLVLR